MITELLLAGAVLLAPADTAARKSLPAHRIAAGEQARVVDGRLDDEVWSRVPAGGDFVQQYPDAGAPATQRTEVRIAYDHEAVYVGVRAWDTQPDSIAAQLARRDATGLFSDWVQVIFDSYHDRRTAYRFAVNPRGVKRDVFHFDDGSEDGGWDAVWEAATTVDAEGWTAEFRIPLSQLRYRAQEAGQAWGLNVLRDVARREERSWWSPMLPDEPGFVSRFGTLTGLEGLRSQRRLEVLPYTVASVTRAPGERADPFYSPTAPFASVGADVKYGLSSDLTLTATINPDFGQVEADPSQVNLSAFESFFSERRPFFVEGADIFRFGVGLGDDNSETLFYSRRIGRAPQRRLSTSGERPFVDTPQQTRILGAAKLTGKVHGWSVGVLDAVTAETRTEYVLAGDPQVHSLVSEPLSNYGMLRLRRDLREGKSAVGGVLTTMHRRVEDGLEFLPSSSYAGGMDFRHRFGGGDWEVSGYAISSLVRGDSAAIGRLQRSPARYYQRPELAAERLDGAATSLSGNGASLHLGRIGGSRYRGGLLGLYRSGGFEVNDLGFLREADKLELAAYGRWFQSTPQGVFRRWNVGWNAFSGWSTTEGERLFTGGNVNGNFQLTNLWNGWWGFERSQGALDVRGLRGGPAIRFDPGWSGWAGFGTDARKPVRYGLETSWGVRDGNDGWRLGLYPSVDLRASGRMTLGLYPNVSWNHTAAQYVAARDDAGTGERRYLFSGLDQTVVAMTTRLNYTFSPTLTLQLYAQPFVAAGEYRGFMEVADPAARRFGDRFRPLSEEARACDGFYGVRPQGAGCGDDAAFAYRFDDPDFNVKQFRSNAVVRWEYRPGSTLFVVWSQGREHALSDGSFRLGRDFGRLFGMDRDVSIPATNVLMVKLNYWLDI